MKLRYFGYYLRQVNTQKKFLFNIKPIIDAYISSTNMVLKSSFKRGDSNLYLTQVPSQTRVYYFVRTSDDELIKRINQQNLTVSDIASQLSANEKVAFASYIHLDPKQSIVACASSTSCPRFDDFANYMNEFLQKVRLSNYEFYIDALTSSNDRADMLKMKMINSVYVDVAADKGLGQLIARELTGNTTSSLGNFRITIEPTGTNLKTTFDAVLSKLAPNSKYAKGVIRIGAKAKHDELKGQLNDVWLDNENNLADSLNPKGKVKLEDQITAKYDANLSLAKLYADYVSNQNLKPIADPLLQKYTNKSQY
ncbi:hypothetical protein [Shewanella chilikensis]|uniref:hypothetical protein n=1 Tax=Shewanella chilikensis TaxID=558541 RepID=UPI00399A2604